MKKTLYWLPRILMIAFIGFLSLFALDVFSEDYGFWESILALFMHLLPTLALVVILILAWKKEFWGGLVLILCGIFFFFAFDVYEEIFSFIFISLPPLLIGGLFIGSYYLNKK